MLNLSLTERLARFTPDLPSDECWEWTGGRHRSGYGYVCFDRRVLYAHRVSYTVHHGPIPAEHFVCHRCDNPPCVNPAHLFIGTPADNFADMKSKGRHARGATNGHARLSEESVRKIRLQVQAGVPQPTIASELGVSQSTVSLVASGRRWGHVV